MTRRLADSPARDVYLDLVRAHERLVGQFAELFRAHGTTQTQFNVLRVLIQAPDQALPCQAIGARLIHRVPDVTRLIDRMERSGWVERRRGEADRRVVQVHLTDAGRALCEGLYDEVDALHRRQLAHLAPAQLERLRRGLADLLAPA